MNFSINSFASTIEGAFLQRAHEYLVEKAIIDSRTNQGGASTAFFAIAGINNDGHQYIGELYRRGVRTFVVERSMDMSDWPEATIIHVQSSTRSLQLLAETHRQLVDLPVLAITGSNGKTIVKEWIYQALFRDFNIVRSPKSYNSQVGVPLSVLLIERPHTLGIFEAGISKPGEMDALRETINPTLGIFTNIGSAHQENFSSIEAKIKEKLKLFSHCTALIYCADHKAIAVLAKSQLPTSVKQITWSKSEKADLKIEKIEKLEAGRTHLTALWKGEMRAVTLPFQLDASIENCCHIWTLLLHWNFSDLEINERFSHLEPVNMRLQLLEGVNGSTLINDAYNSDLNAIEIALDFLKTQVKNTKFTAILSDIQQSGEDAASLYAKLADLLRSKGINRFIGIGPELSQHQSVFTQLETAFFLDTSAFLANWRKLGFQQENMLLKGARSFHFEDIADALQEKTHETVLEINLNKMAQNLSFIRSKLRRQTKLIAMVKAFGYGSGGYDVARFLSTQGVDYLAVAYADEGFELRRDGINLPILVLNPEAASFDAMIRLRLEPQLFSFRILEQFEHALKNAAVDEPFPVHIKINTGMNRLGFDSQEMDLLAEKLSSAKAHLQVKSVFSHLAASEDPKFDEKSREQIARFQDAADRLADSLGYSFMRHILNSSGILRHPQAEFDAVRLGLGLYGLISQTEAREQFQFVSRLVSRISQLRTVAAGEGVGYSPKETLEKDSRIAVVPIGYADGLPRSLGNGRGQVKIQGQLCPFVGNICMDMCMVDVTHVACSEGDLVVIYESSKDIYRLSEAMGSIPYELISQLSNRVKRVYIQE